MSCRFFKNQTAYTIAENSISLHTLMGILAENVTTIFTKTSEIAITGSSLINSYNICYSNGIIYQNVIKSKNATFSSIEIVTKKESSSPSFDVVKCSPSLRSC